MGHWQTGHSIQEGKYMIDRILGYGGSGVTYCASDRASGQTLAIKTLNALAQTQDNFAKLQEDFIQEAFRLAKCNHNHVIRVDNVCQEDNLWCMVMEYIAGGNLRQYVNQRGVLSETEALRYIQQIGSALTYVHQQGFLHRDVKPANIMLRRGTFEAVLIDFGLAREFTQNETQTHTNSRTESFAPLEQYELRAQRGAYTDVYALAATLYYLVTLQLPFPAPFRQQGVEIIPPQQHNASLSDRLNAAIIKGMELLPQNRPQSVEAWLALFQPNVVVAPIMPVVPPPWQEARRSPTVPLNPARQEQLNAQAKIPLRSPPTLDKSVPSFQPRAVARVVGQSPDLDQSSPDCPSDYLVLQQFLVGGRFKEADQETAKILLKAVDRDKAGWLDRLHVENLPCEVLSQVDRLWGATTKQHFGFSVQHRIYRKVGGMPTYHADSWRNFGDRVGWRGRNSNNWLSYKDLTFALWAPDGHLPMMGMHFWGFSGWIAVLMTRLEQCQL